MTLVQKAKRELEAAVNAIDVAGGLTNLTDAEREAWIRAAEEYARRASQRLRSELDNARRERARRSA